MFDIHSDGKIKEPKGNVYTSANLVTGRKMSEPVALITYKHGNSR